MIEYHYEKRIDELENEVDNLKNDIKTLMKKNIELTEALDKAYTLASRHYRSGAMEQIEKLLDEVEDKK